MSVPADVALVCDPTFCHVDEGTGDLSGFAVVVAIITVAFVWDLIARRWPR